MTNTLSAWINIVASDVNNLHIRINREHPFTDIIYEALREHEVECIRGNILDIYILDGKLHVNAFVSTDLGSIDNYKKVLSESGIFKGKWDAELIDYSCNTVQGIDIILEDKEAQTHFVKLMKLYGLKELVER